MNFYEFLIASDNKILAEYLQNKNDYSPLAEPIHEKLLSLYKIYLYLGGMPEVIKGYITTKNPARVQEIKHDILLSYERDFSKYATPYESIKISDIWNSIPAQLAKENKKFRYKEVSKNGRASVYKLSIEWLRKAGLVSVSYNIKVPKLPLIGYQDRSKFKLFLCDTGILCAKLDIDSKIIVTGDDLFSEYNGAFIENYVSSELTSLFKSPLYYWSSKSDAEVDFILHINNQLFPLEVKSGYTKGIKSLRSYAKKYSPKKILRTSPRNFNQDNDFYNIPLYAIGFIKNLIH
jgi:predicted AAA+ superfamily ATPase